MKRTMTTEQVARMLEVNKSTVKRWSDSGKIRCSRTLGHHRKFQYDDVMEFAEKNNIRSGLLPHQNEQIDERSVIREMVRLNDLNIFRSVIAASSLQGNKSEIVDLLQILYKERLPYTSILTEIILPVLQKLERTVQQHRLEFQRCTVARTTVSSAFSAFSDRIERVKRRNSLIILYTFEPIVEPELKIVESKLEFDGYLTVNLGAVRSWTVVEQWIGKSGADMMLCLLKQTQNRTGTASDFIALEQIAESRGMLFLCGTLDHCIGMDLQRINDQLRRTNVEISNSEL